MKFFKTQEDDGSIRIRDNEGGLSMTRKVAKFLQKSFEVTGDQEAANEVRTALRSKPQNDRNFS